MIKLLLMEVDVEGSERLRGEYRQLGSLLNIRCAMETTKAMLASSNSNCVDDDPWKKGDQH